MPVRRCLALALVLSFALSAAPAWATTARALSNRAMTEAAALILTGRCVDVRSAWEGRTLVTLATVEVTDVLKGELGFEGFLISDYNALDQLPGEVLVLIAAHLPYHSFCALRLVSRQFCELLETRSLWRSLVQRHVFSVVEEEEEMVDGVEVAEEEDGEEEGDGGADGVSCYVSFSDHLFLPCSFS